MPSEASLPHGKLITFCTPHRKAMVLTIFVFLSVLLYIQRTARTQYSETPWVQSWSLSAFIQSSIFEHAQASQYPDDTRTSISRNFLAKSLHCVNTSAHQSVKAFANLQTCIPRNQHFRGNRCRCVSKASSPLLALTFAFGKGMISQKLNVSTSMV